MENFRHSIPTELLFGKDQIKNLPEIMRRYGNNILLAYGGGSIKRSGLHEEIYSLLKDFNIYECDGIEPNPRIETVKKGVEICRENNVDVILAVGGGSTIDCSKAIAGGVYYDGDLWEMVKTSGAKKFLPLVSILTLSATGSEFDSGAVISNLNTNEKLVGGFKCPDVSICDPTYTYSVPEGQTAAGSADIMSHIMEGYFSRTDDSFVSDGLAETILKTVIKYLPIALKKPDNYEARANLMWASSLACSGMPEYGKIWTHWTCHELEHELSAYYDITHGVGLAILTPRWMRFILKKDPSVTSRFVKFAKNVWGLDGDSDYELANAGIDALEKLFTESNIPMTLSELNIDDKYFEVMAKHAHSTCDLGNAYVGLSVEDIIQIYKNCL